MKLNPYLNFNGNCEEAFQFYSKVLNGTDMRVMKFRDSPMGEKMPEAEKDMVVHARFNAGDTTVMGSDGPGGHYNKPQGYATNIDVETPEEAERIFAALSEGGNVGMPIQETFWAKRFGMVTDRFGTPWMVNCEKPMG
ncbi:MAG TPA: VOC family protein [Steroidobacteraceae bacterium]|nr:VOC family protein [Steroidobacteraceae bacterium]